jgi:quercetin dioxygenase-like cupin family protein
LAVGIAGA